MYPAATGGPLVYVEPGLDVEGFGTSTKGGWFSAPPELEAMLAGYRMQSGGAKLVGEPVPAVPVVPSVTAGEVDGLDQPVATAPTLSIPSEVSAAVQRDAVEPEVAQRAAGATDAGQLPRPGFAVVAAVALVALVGALSVWRRKRVAPR
jgi:hypothetical protein